MSYSLNEVEALSKRAARGAGLAWGMSEDAAKATRWLASHDLAGVALLADVLVQNDKLAHDQVAPRSLFGVWQSRSGVLCPLVSGTALSDCADRLERDQPIEMSNVSHPLLVVPFAAWSALHIAAPIAVSWLDVRIVTDGSGLWIDDPNAQINVKTATSLSCMRVTRPDEAVAAPTLRGKVEQSAWVCLNAFAHRTFAPATEESRLLGAGAGVSDND